MATACCWPSRRTMCQPSMSPADASLWRCRKTMTMKGIIMSNDDALHRSEPMTSWSATVLTLFPEMFPGPLGVSLLGKALANNLWALEVRDIRAHGLGKHRTVDDTPAGGGPGMVMRADVAAAAIDAVDLGGRALIYPSPRGPRLTQSR